MDRRIVQRRLWGAHSSQIPARPVARLCAWLGRSSAIARASGGASAGTRLRPTGALLCPLRAADRRGRVGRAQTGEQAHGCRTVARSIRTGQIMAVGEIKPRFLAEVADRRKCVFYFRS